MRPILLAALSVLMAAPAAAQPADPLTIHRSGGTPSGKGPATTFTGTVRVDRLFERRAPGRAGGSAVTFEPGARTHWHTHPLGQTLVVTFGRGWVQREGGPVEEVQAGDVVQIPAGARHWHGATATTAMTHIAITESLDGKAVEWMEAVPEAAYRSGPKPPGE